MYERKLQGVPSEHGRRLHAEARLEHLEQLVQTLSESRQTDHSGIASSGIVSRGKDEISTDVIYNGATHWSAMLEDIEELRNVIMEGDEIDDVDLEFSNNEDEGTVLLLGGTGYLSFQEVLSRYLPSRHDADRLVATYFRAKAVSAPFIHAAQFRRLYLLFWERPSTTSALWASILFSILHIATTTLSASFVVIDGDKNKTDRFTIAAAHCLAVGKYHKPQRFSVEALLLYVQSKCLTSVDISPDLAILFGTLTRIATIMGYHRDANEIGEGLSTFEGELRRRTWSLCMQLDMLISFQLGLPSTIQFPTWDTRPPSNLLDSDFDEDTVNLPPPRPDSEPTELLFYIAKHKLMAVFEKIIRHVLSTIDRSNAELLELLDLELQSTYAAIPTVLQPRTMDESICDSPSVIVTRLCVSFLYQKCRCVLHQKYVICGRLKSIRICHSSASDILKQFLDSYEEFEPGGQLETERWFMGSITWHDFLLGCTALCLTICSIAQSAHEPHFVDVAESLKLLKNAKVVCENQPSRSRDTRKVRRLLEATIFKFSDEDNRYRPIIEAPRHTDERIVSDTDWVASQSYEGEKDWLWDQGNIRSGDDAAWVYMEQFLNLPNEDFATEN